MFRAGVSVKSRGNQSHGEKVKQRAELNRNKKSNAFHLLKLLGFIGFKFLPDSSFIECRFLDTRIFGRGESLESSNISNLSSRIEFSNNGVFDSLTGAPAPKTFFDNLAREISQSRRRFQPIAVITIKLLQENEKAKPLKNSKQGSTTAKDSKSTNLLFEKQLAIMSNTIKTNMRGGDFYSRMAEDGFWLCLQGNLAEANSTAGRFEAKISDNLEKLNRDVRVEVTSTEWSANLDSNFWVEEIDKKYFLSHKQRSFF
jgi:GGDEF domain-containing protein